MTAPADVTLRPVRPDDWTRIHEWASLEEVVRYQAWGPNTPGQTRAFAREAADEWDRTPPERYVWVAERDGLVVGIAELHLLRPGVGELGYGVHRDLWRQGLGTAIAALVRDAAFASLGLHRVQATCDPRNLGSVRVLQGVGMRLEGTLRENLEIRDGWRDSHVFGLLVDEWRDAVLQPRADLVRF